MDLSNLTMNDTFESLDQEEPFETEIDPFSIIKCIVALVSAFSNIFIIFIIARYSVLQTRSNFYLANWCISNLILMLLVPIFVNLFGITDVMSYEMMCVWDESLYALFFGNFLFALILLLDWYVSIYTKQNCTGKCKNLHIFITVIVWILVLAVAIGSVSFCVMSLSYPLSLTSFLLGYFLLFVIVVTINVLRLVKIIIFKQHLEKNRLVLIFVTSFFFCWLPNWISMYGQIALGIFFSDTFIQCTYLLGYSHSIFMLLIVYFCDKSFQFHIRKTFGCDKERTCDTNNQNKEQITGLL
ncbi:hypothetical protein ABEB36_008687 [Hypothenemus hampei]|uniref:G-protein coupled receptors family 1 profile domain-containing protein n=1 Tax=Hypothenemus hampei TaxID=57062 RepID=A0ABD1EMR1_HYPHA